MRIDVGQLRKEDIIYDVRFSPEFLKQDIDEDLRFDPAVGQVVFHMVRDEVIAEGCLSTTAYLRCARCLAETPFAASAPVHLYYWPGTKQPDPQSTIEDVTPDEPDMRYYVNDAIEPDEDLREILLIEIPTIILCREDCKGLCPHCGANRNEEPCDCRDEDVADAAMGTSDESPWKNQLKDIRRNLGED